MGQWVILIFLLFFLGVFFLILDSRHGYLRRLDEWLRQSPKAPIWVKFITTAHLAFGLYAAILFVVVSAVNICSWFPNVVGQYVHSLMWLHLFVLAAFFVSFGFSQLERKQTDRKNTLRNMPKWAERIVMVLFLYVFSLFALEMIHAHGGYSIRERNGKHYIQSGDDLEREMTADEYLQSEALSLRQFSGLWMGFSFASAAWLLSARANYGGQPAAQSDNNSPTNV